MDTYTSDSNKSGSQGPFFALSPFSNNLTQSGHGNWIRIGKNTFAFTVWRLMTGSDGRPVAKAKFWGAITVDGENDFSGAINGSATPFPLCRVGPLPGSESK